VTGRSPRVAVVGHVEWVEFARIEAMPRPGEVAHATHTGLEPAGGGAVAAVQLARLAGRATLFTALGDDEHGRLARQRLQELGVSVHAAARAEPTRRALTLVDDRGERTIVTLGERLAPRASDRLPWTQLHEADAVYFTAGDAGALQAARSARVLVATPRARMALEGSVVLDALVLSAHDTDEQHEAQRRHADTVALTVLTEGADGGRYRGRSGCSGRWPAADVPGPTADSYGCGDSFAAGLTFALGAGSQLDDALRLAARCGATCLAGHGPYQRQLTAADL